LYGSNSSLYIRIGRIAENLLEVRLAVRRPSDFSPLRALRQFAAAALLAIPLLAGLAPTASGQPASRLRTLSPERLPVANAAQALVGSTLVSADDLVESYRQARLDEFYELQAGLNGAISVQDEDAAREVIAEAAERMTPLVRHPDMVGDGRFVDVYRSMVDAYEEEFGPVDPEFEVAFGDVFTVREELFSTLEGLADPLSPDMAPWHLPLQTVVPMTVNRAVTSSMEFLLERRPKVIATWLERAHTYFPMIEQIFREEGIPEELKYLAMIESGLNPTARSRARAVGMWQFVAATGRAYGLKVDNWVDERRDPEKATRAAARHLKDLYEIHGDWHVALAGYNCSPRCINRARSNARKAGSSNPGYWEMYRFLPRETRGYVPNLVATAIMLSDPDAYGIRPESPGFRYEYELVPIRGSLALSDVARMAGTDVATIRHLNPSLLRNHLPPSRDPFPLRLPIGTSEAFLLAYAELPAEALKPPGEHVVKRGNTLGAIASQYGVSVSRLKADNNLRSDIIRVGQRLVVPVSSYKLPVDMDVSGTETVVVRYGEMRNRRIVSTLEPPKRLPTSATAAVAEASAPSQDDPAAEPAAEPRVPVVLASTDGEPSGEEPAPEARTVVTYEVRRGDALSKIASRYGVSVRDLQGWNDLRSTRIRAGQELTIYLEGSAPQAESSTEPIIYRVRRGDTLGRIASNHGVPLSDLRSWNGIQGSVIRPGQRLRIYPSGTGHEVRTHRVVRGDNLSDLARRYGVTVSELRSWNELRSNRIYPGQSLRILR
jgi:membrane-bound lytic murein transglycosylase D